MTAITGRPRRSQAERREATRTALLDATIDSLVKYGYANLTTEAIVRRAGVTRGAHAHYFTSKADLMVQALDRLTTKIRTEAEKTLTPLTGDSTEEYEELVDRLWEIHKGPLFTAALELHVAGRTDKDLRVHLRRFDRELAGHLTVLALRYVPKLVVVPGFDKLFITAMATMRGVALLGFTASENTVESMWRDVRDELLRAGVSELSEQLHP